MNSSSSFAPKSALSSWIATAGNNSVQPESGNSITRLVGGDYLVASNYYNFVSGFYETMVISYDSQGDVNWERKLANPSANMYGDWVEALNDGTALVAGRTHLTKFDSLGAEVWQREFSQLGALNVVKQIPGGDILLVAYSTNTSLTPIPSSGGNTYILRLDSSGNTVWSRSLGQTSGGGGRNITDASLTSDNHIILVGTSGSAGLIAKFDFNGNLIWKRTLSPSSSSNAFYGCVVDNTTGHAYVVGTGYNSASFYSTQLIVKYDLDGNVVWKYLYGGSGGNTLTSVKVIDSSTIIVAGKTQAFYYARTAKVDTSTGDVIQGLGMQVGSGVNYNEFRDVRLHGSYVYLTGTMADIGAGGPTDRITTVLPLDWTSKIGNYIINGTTLKVVSVSLGTKTAPISYTEADPAAIISQTATISNTVGSITPTDASGTLTHYKVTI